MRYRFQLHNDFIFNKHINSIGFLNLYTIIYHRQIHLGLNFTASLFKFYFQCCFISTLQ